MLESLCKNHPFYDGNKRVAWVAMKTFLLVNGFHVKATADEAEDFLIVQVIPGKIELSAIASWLEKRCQ